MGGGSSSESVQDSNVRGTANTSPFHNIEENAVTVNIPSETDPEPHVQVDVHQVRDRFADRRGGTCAARGRRERRRLPGGRGEPAACREVPRFVSHLSTVIKCRCAININNKLKFKLQLTNENLNSFLN